MTHHDGHAFGKRKRPYSIFIKLLLVLLATGFLVVFLVSGFFRLTTTPNSKQLLQKHLSQYTAYLMQDIGSSPDTVRARKIAEDLGIEIRYEKSGVTWATSATVPFIREMQRPRWNQFPNVGWLRGRYFVVAQNGTAEFLFITEAEPPAAYRDEFVLLLIALLVLIIAAAYFSIRRLFKPIRWLMRGVTELSQGNLTHQIPIRRKDELGELAASFNAMTARLRQMIQAKEQLLLDVSHELRSPLTRMKVALEFIDDDKMKASLAEDISEMEAMISELLESDRLSSPHGKLNVETLNLSALIKEVAEPFVQRPPSVTLTNFADGVFIKADAGRMKTVLKNILDNAVKYSSPESKPIEISLDASDADIVTVQVRDYGLGIAADDLPFVFEPFYRTDKSRSKETGGYGLGMSLVKKIMDAHQGSVSISSTLGGGTTVTLMLKKT
jgi:signal transduction histidine kinase